ncbi:MAG: MFS transporter [Nitrospirota bacterium]|nr:MFS transporter [Nitrospirota bacterium]
MKNRARLTLRAIRENPTIAAVSAEGFLTRLGFGMVGFALPLYALALGMNVAEIGLLYALRTVVTVAVKPLAGWAADRYGKKKTLVLAVVLRCIVGFLFIFATLPWHLYAIRILSGFMTAARDPSAAALIAEHGDRKNMASAYAWYTTAREVGKSMGAAAAGLLITFYAGYQITFIVAFVTSCIALVTVIIYVRESREDAEKKPEPKEVSIKETVPMEEAKGLARYRGFLGYASFGLMVALTAEMMKGLFPVIAVQYAHLTEAEAGIAASASSVALLVAGPLFGWLSDNYSRNLVLSSRSIANTVSSVLYIYFPNFSGFLVARVMDDTGKAAFRPAWGAMMAEITEKDPARRGRTIANIDSAATLGEVLGPLLAGVMMATFGVPAMLGVRVALSVITEIQAVLVFRQRQEPVVKPMAEESARL